MVADDHHGPLDPAVRTLKSTVRALLGSPLALQVVRAIGPRRAAIFMMHRFMDPALGGVGTGPAALRSILAGLRKSRVILMSAHELIQHIEQRRQLKGPTAVFAVDDGYRDFLTAGAPVLAEFDCPVTVFLVSRFVDGAIWCWWDRIEYAFLGSPRAEITVTIGERNHRFALADVASRRTAAAECAELLKKVPDGERQTVVAGIGTEAGVEVPTHPPAQYSAMTWDEVRSLESDLVSFGPHTRHHPILSQVEDEVSVDEIAGSWADLQRECRRPAPVFCYPNGTFDAYGDREMRVIRESGLTGALAAYDGYVEPRLAVPDLFRLPRFPLPDDATTASFQASGLARVPER